MRPALRGVARAVGAQRGCLDLEVRSGLFEHVLDHRIAREDARDGLIIGGRVCGDVVAQSAVCAGEEICACCGVSGGGYMGGLCGETALCGHRQQYGCCETQYESVHEQALLKFGSVSGWVGQTFELTCANSKGICPDMNE